MKIKKRMESIKRFRSYSDTNNGIKSLIWMIFLWLKYGVTVNEYYDNKLYDKDINHKSFLESQLKYCRSWKIVSKHYKPSASKFWLLTHRVDYWISKIIYPGLDAMDYFMYEFYNFKHGKRKTFVTEGALKKLDLVLNGENIRIRNILDDKCEFNVKFKDLIGRKWIDARNMTREDFIKFANNLDAALVKPLKGMQGKGIYKVSLNSEESINSVYKECAGKDYIIEEIIEQCEETRKFNPSSVNTIRVYSVFYNGQVIITGAVQRMGNGDTVCDNYSSGGLAASIDVESGIIISRAVSKNNESLYIHPYTNMVIIGTQIPRWCDVIATVKAAHQLISGLRYVAWDVVVCNNGKIALLEANTGGGVGILQHPTLVGVNPIYKKYMKNIER